MSFAGKTVLVTGSTTGIGEACAHVFAESGARVMVSGRHEERGSAVVEAIRTAGGSAEFGVQSTGRHSYRPDVSLRLGVGRCNWSGGRKDGGAARLSRPPI